MSSTVSLSVERLYEPWSRRTNIVNRVTLFVRKENFVHHVVFEDGFSMFLVRHRTSSA